MVIAHARLSHVDVISSSDASKSIPERRLLIYCLHIFRVWNVVGAWQPYIYKHYRNLWPMLDAWMPETGKQNNKYVR